MGGGGGRAPNNHNNLFLLERMVWRNSDAVAMMVPQHLHTNNVTVAINLLHQLPQLPNCLPDH